MPSPSAPTATAPTFAQLGLPRALCAALADRSIIEPFPVQAATIPDALAGRDVLGRAPTGSGKTLAFGLPLLLSVGEADAGLPGALVLAPTRELAEQIKGELAPLGRRLGRRVHAVYGGVPYGPQKRALEKGVDVLVATPGRLEDLIEQGCVDLGEAAIVVIDEADRMADMGFVPAVRRILDRTARNRQTMLFSATLDGDVAEISARYQTNPVRHEAGGAEPESGDARHHFWLVEHADRVRHTAEVVTVAGRSIVFTRTRHGADRLARQLTKTGVSSVALHGGRSQNQRNRALRAFSTGQAEALVATDVAARGIHVESVAAVVHYDPPADDKDYLHRSGRTARAGETGTVVSLVTAEQRRAVRRLQRALELEIPLDEPRPERVAGGGHAIGETSRGVPGRRTAKVGTGAGGRSAGRSNSGASRGHAAGRSRSIYVANLPWKATADDLTRMFAPHGDVLAATVVTDRRTGRSKGFGFVDMPSTVAQSAVDAVATAKLGGRPLTVRIAKPPRRRRR